MPSGDFNRIRLGSGLTGHNEGDDSVTVSVDGTIATDAELAAHAADTTSAHTAAGVDIVDAGGYFSTDNVEAALQALAAGSVGPTPAIARLADTTVAGSVAASIDFSSISASYKHLLILISGRSDRTATVDTIGLRFNNDSGNNYDFAQIQGTGSPFVVSGADTIATSSLRLAVLAAANATAGRAGGGVIFIPNYLGTTFGQIAFGVSGSIEGTTAGNIRPIQLMGGWRTANAINRVTAISTNGANFVIGSRMTLYGLS